MADGDLSIWKLRLEWPLASHRLYESENALKEVIRVYTRDEQAIDIKLLEGLVQMYLGYEEP